MPGESATARITAVLATVLVVSALVGCTEEEPVATTVPASTTSTTEPASVFIPASSTLTLVESDDSLAPLDLVATDERIFLFAEDRSTGRLVVWSTQDGSNWTDHGEPFPEGARLATATGLDDRVVVATAGLSGENPSLWSTTDGISWDVEEVPMDSANGLMEFTAEAVTVEGPTKVLAGYSQLAAEGLVESKIRETIWPGFDRQRYGLNIQPLNDDIKIDLLAPLGLKLINTTGTELGLSSQEQEWIREGTGSFAFETWVGLDDGSWTPAFIDGAGFVNSLTGAGGTIVAVGHSESGSSASWITFDGIIWERVSSDLRPDQVKDWDGRLVGSSATGHPDLLVSDDGLEWVPTGVGDHLPPGEDWFMWSFDATPSGVVASFGAFYVESQNDEVLELPQIEKGGVRVVAQEYGIIRMYEGEDESIEYLWSSSVDYGPEKVVFDIATETVHFFRDDGSELVSLTVDELETLNEQFFSASNNLGSFHRMLMFSRDGQTWTVWEADFLEDNIDPIRVSVIDSTVVVVGRDRSQQSGFGIWVTETG